MKIRMNRKQKNIIYRLIIGAAIFAAGFAVPENIITFGTKIDFSSLFINLAACIIISYDLIINTCKRIARGEIFNEDFLMCIAAAGAFCTGEFHEAVEVMMFFQAGQLFESYSVSSSRESISGLMNMYPEKAVVIRDGEEITVSPDEICTGETILVRPGEKIPVDGTIIKGESSVDTSALTGESIPQHLKAGSEIISGSVNMSGVLQIRADKAFEDSTAAKILELVENASDKKSSAENFVSRFAKYYTPVVVILAFLAAFVPPLISLMTGGSAMWISSIKNALIFLVVSCPCAVVISVPLAFFGAIGGASKDGILIKGGNYLESLSKADAVVMDKTGTLTEGKFSVTEIKPVDISKEELLKYASYAEYFSNHPIAVSLKNAYNKEIDTSLISDVSEKAGYGVCAKADGVKIIAGKYDFLKNSGITPPPCSFAGTVVYVAADGKYSGYIGISDKIKPDSAGAVEKMRKLGIKTITMLTGDSKETGEHVGRMLGLDMVYSKLLPADKVTKMQEMKSSCRKGSTIIFAGDGMNDAPVLSAADVGIAMGALGSDAAIEAADIVIMDDKPSKIPSAIKRAKKCMGIVWTNVVFALGIKVLVLILAATGNATMLMGIFADVGVSIICILNSMRMLGKNKK